MFRVEICGNIASGKTTLCQGVAKASKMYQPLFEDFQNNPFYEDFYINPAAYSFETEITFLLQHYHLIKKQRENQPLVCDYSLLLDLAYADVNLDGERFRIFSELVEEIQKEIGLPEKIIHLVCPANVLLQRIIERSREAETAITIDYLSSLSEAISLRIEEISNQLKTITIDSNLNNFTSGIENISGRASIFQ